MLEVTEYVRDLAQGMTRPSLCLANDGKYYVVKGREALNAGLIKELMSTHLAKAFGLAVPNCEVIEFSESLFWGDPQLERRFGGAACFASEYIPYVQEFGRSEMLADKHAQLMRDLFIFDFWIKNDDRHFSIEHGGNPNLLIDQVKDSIIVIDHNLAFADDFDLQSFRKTHVGSKFWFKDTQGSLFTEQEYKPRIDIAMANLEQYIDLIPSEWFENDDTGYSVIDNITTTLNQVNTEKFWSAIR